MSSRKTAKVFLLSLTLPGALGQGLLPLEAGGPR